MSDRRALLPGQTVRVVVAMLLTVGLDRVTKSLAVTHLAEQPWRSYLGGVVRVGYAENTGGLLGIGSGLPPGIRTLVFTVGTGLLLLGLTFVALRRRWIGLPLLGTALVVAGGASNWIDRVTRGSVVDFLNVGIGSVRTGIFNVADIAIFVGLGLFLLPQPAGSTAEKSS